MLTLAIAFSYDCRTARDNVPCFGVQLFLVMGMDIQQMTDVLLTLQNRRRNKKPRVSWQVERGGLGFFKLLGNGPYHLLDAGKKKKNNKKRTHNVIELLKQHGQI